jgi:hypothetical protein
MDELKQLAFASVKELTTNLLYLSLGVFVLVGGFLTSAKKDLVARKTLFVSLACFGVSFCFGGFALMHLTGAVVGNNFDPTAGFIRGILAAQIIAAVVGCVFFLIFLWHNLWN